MKSNQNENDAKRHKREGSESNAEKSEAYLNALGFISTSPPSCFISAIFNFLPIRLVNRGGNRARSKAQKGNVPEWGVSGIQYIGIFIRTDELQSLHWLELNALLNVWNLTSIHRQKACSSLIRCTGVERCGCMSVCMLAFYSQVCCYFPVEHRF